MFNIIDTRTGSVVAEAFDFKEAKRLATTYRRYENLSKDPHSWKKVQIKKKVEAPIRTFYSEPCCDSLRDRNCEMYGRPHS